MIFVTVGAQMPFDRLVRAVDDWAGKRGRRDVFAQVGPTSFCPANIPYAKFLEPPDFDSKVREASVIVAHAGMGSILTALEVGKPILIMPRRGDLKETRNDHQVATARRFQGRTAVAFDETELAQRLDEIDSLSAASRISSRASDLLAQSLLGFVERGKLPCAEFRGFDSAICFGEGRGALELAMMRELSSRVPVLYLTPTDARRGVVLERMGRAVQALTGRGGATKIGTNLWTRGICFDDDGLDGGYLRMAKRVRRLACGLGFRHPLVWAALPIAGVVERIPHAALVCDCAGAESWIAKSDVNVIVRRQRCSDAGAEVERVLAELARRGIHAAGAYTSHELLGPLSPANSDLQEWGSRPGAELGAEMAH